MHIRPHGRRLVLRAALLLCLTTVGWALPAHAERDVERPTTLRHNVPVSASPVVPGFPIDFVGVIWDENEDDGEHGEHAAKGGEAHGAVRFRHGSEWGAWVPLAADGADAPGQWTSSLVGGADADAFQVRGVPDHAHGPRVVALNTTDGPLRVVGSVPDGPQALAKCKTREEWGADPALMTWDPESTPAQVMTVHHTVTSNDDTDPDATVRAIYEYHAVDNGWGDIGYHYLVGPDGLVYEGRYSGGTSEPCTGDSDGDGDVGDGADFAHASTAAGADVVTAAHTGGNNSGNVGVALLGDFSYHRAKDNTPTSAATASLEDVLVELSYRHGIPADAKVIYKNPVTGEAKEVQSVSGHRDWKATECPGDNLYALLPDVRSRVAARVAAMGPGVSITSPVEGAEVVGEFTASVDSAEAVRVDLYLGETLVGTDTTSSDGWAFVVDTDGGSGTAAVADGSYQLSAVATDAAGATGRDAVSVIVDNEPDPVVTVSVVDLDAHTHTRGGRWDAHAVVQVADSDGNSLPDAYVDGVFTGDGIPPTAATCQIDVTRCELHLDGLDKRLVSSVVFTVEQVRDAAGSYDAGSNTDPDIGSDGLADSDPLGTQITISP